MNTGDYFIIIFRRKFRFSDNALFLLFGGKDILSSLSRDVSSALEAGNRVNYQEPPGPRPLDQ